MTMKFIAVMRLTGAVLLLTAGYEPARAQQSSDPDSTRGEDQFAEIVVTAQRREQSIMSVPASVTAMSGDALRTLGITQVNALASIVPNLQINDPTGGEQPNFTLRGVGLGNEYDDNQASPIGIYVDDAYEAFRTMHGTQLYDLQRVEVIAGPQGTLFGRNTTGGAINFITNKPTLSGSSGFIDVGYGNYDDERVQSAVEITPVAGVFGIRLAGSFERHDAYIVDGFPGQPNMATEKSPSVRLSLRWRPIDDLDFNLRLYDSSATQYQPGVYQVGPGPGGANAITGYSRAGLGFYDTNADSVAENGAHSRGAELTVKYKLTERLSLQSLTSIDSGNSVLGQDVDGSPVDVLRTSFRSDYKQFNQELRLLYSGSQIDVQGGAYYGWDQITPTNRYAFFGFLQALGAPADPTLTHGGATITQDYRQVRASEAVFAQADYKITPKLIATLGLRDTHDRAEYRDGTAFIGDYDFQPLVQTVGTPGEPLSKDGSSSAVTGKTALSYTFDRGNLVYGSFSRGYRAGTFNGSGYLAPSQVSYVEPETVNAYEVGFKGRLLDGALTYSTALFYYDYSNQQILDVVGVVGFLRNAGKASLKGIDFETTARASDALTAIVNIGLLSTDYKTLTLQDTDLSGNRMPFAPSATANLRLDWRVWRFAPQSELVLTPSVTYTSKVYFTPYNNALGNETLRQDGMTITNASLEWRKDEWVVSAWTKNVFDTHYFVYGLNLESFGFNYLNQGNPRTFGLSVHRTF